MKKFAAKGAFPVPSSRRLPIPPLVTSQASSEVNCPVNVVLFPVNVVLTTDRMGLHVHSTVRTQEYIGKTV